MPKGDVDFVGSKRPRQQIKPTMVETEKTERKTVQLHYDQDDHEQVSELTESGLIKGCTDVSKFIRQAIKEKLDRDYPKYQRLKALREELGEN